jgi:glycosyltransferase involved in cell wall biosynthesis
VPGEEDFAITPVEAQAAGRPVVAFGAGGALETVVPGVTGVFFHEQTPEALAAAVRALDAMPVQPAAIRAHAQTFDISVFIQRVRTLVDVVLRERAAPAG